MSPVSRVAGVGLHIAHKHQLWWSPHELEHVNGRPTLSMNPPPSVGLPHHIRSTSGRPAPRR